MIDPSNLWLTIHESIGHATELDRALGYEAAYAGTSFATLDKLGTLKYGSPVMNVTGDRTVEHGLATIGYDDEGVATQQFDIVSDGMLVGYQLNRQMAHDNASSRHARSNGCAFADSAGHIPLQRMANVSLQPAPDGPSTEELISGVERGIYVVGDRSWSIDMQRFNFQFTGQQFHRIENGTLVGQLRDVAYQATTTDFWGSMEAVGGPRHVRARRRVQLRQGPARPGRGGLARLPGRAVPRRQRPEHRERGEATDDPDPGTRRGGAGSVRPPTAASSSPRSTPRRTCGGPRNSLTTNGQMRTRSITVISTVDGADGTSAGVRHPRGHHRGRARRPGARRRAARPRRRAGRRRRAAGRATTTHDDDWDADPAETGVEVFERFAPAPRRGVRAWAKADRLLFGFAEHQHDLDLPRHVDRPAAPLRPARRPGRDQRQVRRLRPRRPTSSQHTNDFADVDVAALTDALRAAARLGRASRIDLPAGRYETILPPGTVADLMIYAYWTASARDAEEGRNVFAGRQRRDADRRAALAAAAAAVLRPGLPGPAVRAVRDRARSPRPGCSSVFDNGAPVPARPTGSRDGTLTDLIRTRAWAAQDRRRAAAVRRQPDPRRRRHRRASTDMIADTERGLLLTCLWYIREVDPQTLLLTGLTRDGVYLVENGEVQGAVNNFRFNESPIDLLGRAHRGRPHRAGAVAGVERLLPPHRDAGRCGSPTSTCRRSARRPDRRDHVVADVLEHHLGAHPGDLLALGQRVQDEVLQRLRVGHRDVHEQVLEAGRDVDVQRLRQRGDEVAETVHDRRGSAAAAAR